MARSQDPSSRFLLVTPLPFGKLELETADYQEFACSKATAGWLLGGAMTHVDGRPVRLKVVDDWGANVTVHLEPEGEPE